MQRHHGVVLTYVDSLDQLEDCVRRGGYDTVKVVTGWGVESGWTPENKARVLHMVPHVIVRTVAGDPSASREGQNHDFPLPEQVEKELDEWYRIKPSLFIEIGNEPNINNPSDDFIWEWRYYLSQTIAHCRKLFPRASLIMGGLLMQHAERFCEIAHDVMHDCDYIGVHVYEYYGFHASQQVATTNDLKRAVALYTQFFKDKRWFITEYGINDTTLLSPQEKGWRYAGMVHLNESHPPLPPNVKGATYFHLNTRGDLLPAYHIYPAGDETYQQRTARLPAGTPEFPTPEVIGSLLPQLNAMIATLTERERELIALRDEAAQDSGEQFTVAQDLELHQVQSLRAILEAALSSAHNNGLVAQQLITAASSRIEAWNRRQNQVQS